jgi:hypothetical protein
MQNEDTFFPLPLMDMMFLKEGDWLFDDLVKKPKPGKLNKNSKSFWKFFSFFCVY